MPPHLSYNINRINCLLSRLHLGDSLKQYKLCRSKLTQFKFYHTKMKRLSSSASCSLHCSVRNFPTRRREDVFSSRTHMNTPKIFMSMAECASRRACLKAADLYSSTRSAWKSSHTAILQTRQMTVSTAIPLEFRCRLHSMQDFTMVNGGYTKYLESLTEELTRWLSVRAEGGSVDNNRFVFLEAVTLAVSDLKKKYAEVKELKSMAKGDDEAEFQTLVKTEIEEIQQHIQVLEEKLVELLVGTEPADKNDILLEASAGVGGQEAMLFTAEMFEMYASYASYKNWSFDIVAYDKSELGGVRHASAMVAGYDVFKHLKHEAGVHRVQRVPKTERAGRVHTSTMTVSVLPQPTQIDITVNPKDLHIDTFRATGAGGQHVNKTESAVRIVHKPSGIVAECQQDRSQIKNRELAMKIILSRLYQKQLSDQEAAFQHKRKMQVGSAGRSEKIRTYNFSQDRITDHRGPITFHNVVSFMTGTESFDDLVGTLLLQSRLLFLKEVVNQFMQTHQKR